MPTLSKHTTDISVYHEQLHDFTAMLLIPFNKIFYKNMFKRLHSSNILRLWLWS